MSSSKASSSPGLRNLVRSVGLGSVPFTITKALIEAENLDETSPERKAAIDAQKPKINAYNPKGKKEDVAKKNSILKLIALYDLETDLLAKKLTLVDAKKRFDTIAAMPQVQVWPGPKENENKLENRLDAAIRAARGKVRILLETHPETAAVEAAAVSAYGDNLLAQARAAVPDYIQQKVKLEIGIGAKLAAMQGGIPYDWLAAAAAIREDADSTQKLGLHELYPTDDALAEAVKAAYTAQAGGRSRKSLRKRKSNRRRSTRRNH
jgi:hypothetical protein